MAENNYQDNKETSPSFSPLSAKGWPKWAVYILSLLGVVYLFNPGAGILELLPDNLPLVGNLDEGYVKGYYEDKDIVQRVVEAGYEMVKIGHVKEHHFLVPAADEVVFPRFRLQWPRPGILQPAASSHPALSVRGQDVEVSVAVHVHTN